MSKTPTAPFTQNVGQALHVFSDAYTPGTITSIYTAGGDDGIVTHLRVSNNNASANFTGWLYLKPAGGSSFRVNKLGIPKGAGMDGTTFAIDLMTFLPYVNDQNGNALFKVPAGTDIQIALDAAPESGKELVVAVTSEEF